MNDAFTRAYSAVKGVVQQVVAYLAPAIQGVTDTFTNLIGGIGGANIGEFIGEAIMQGAEFFAVVADTFVSALTTAWNYVASVGIQWADVFNLGGQVAAFLSGVGNAFKFILAAGIVGLTGPITTLAQVGQYLAGLVGMKSPFIDGIIAGAEAFNDSMYQSMNDASNAAAENFNQAFTGVGAAASAPEMGPVSSVLAAARQKIEDAKKQETGLNTPKPPEPAFSGPSTEALKATDSRSKEGVAEMFRLMRGGDNVQQQIAENTRRIADNTGEPEDVSEMEMVGA